MARDRDFHGDFTGKHMDSYGFMGIIDPDAPWCWYIYLQNWVIFEVNVGKYSSTMEHLGEELRG